MTDTPALPRTDLSAVIKAYDVRGVVGEQIDAALVREVGAAMARLLRAESPDTRAVVVGHDMRPSSPELVAAFGDGVAANGLDVVNIGLACTDMLYFASGALDAPGAMFTASHNPARYNGIKLCRAGASRSAPTPGWAPSARRWSRASRPRARAPPPAASGAGPCSPTTRPTCASWSTCRRCAGCASSSTPATGWPATPCPRCSASCRSTSCRCTSSSTAPSPTTRRTRSTPRTSSTCKKRFVAEGADIGLAFDGDADRCFVVDERGEPVSPSAITALVAVRELAKSPGDSVIHNLITSHAVPEIVLEHGGTPVRTRVGHSYIKQVMADTGAVFGGEHSAHYYFRDFWRADSGMLAALHVLAALGESAGPLSALMADYERYAASGEVNSTVADAPAKIAEIPDGHRARGWAGNRTSHRDRVAIRPERTSDREQP